MDEYMPITKIYNNNCVSVEYEGNEHIVTGAGVGFGMKIGWNVDSGRIEKRFEIMDENRSQFEKILENTDIKYINLSRRIIEYAEKELDISINNKMNISLIDHITYAMNRYEEDIQFLPLFDEGIKAFYPREYEVGLKALRIIEHFEKVLLPEEEASYIALHLINASVQTSTSNYAQKITLFIQNALTIIEKSENIIMDRQTPEISRLIVHLKYLGLRILDSKENKEHILETDNEYQEMIGKLHLNSETIHKLSEYILQEYSYIISENESLYLSIHLHQILRNYRKRKGL